MTTNRSIAARLLAISITILAATGIARAAAFTPGNIVVYRVDGGGAALTANGTAVFLDEYTPAGVLVQSVAMPTAGTSGRVVASGNSTTEGFLTRSQDGQYLIVPGYDAAAGTAGITASNTVPRVIGRVDSTGAIDATSSYVDATLAGNLRSATSVDGTRYWTSGSTQGARTVVQGATTATVISSTATNMRQIAVFSNQLYIGSGAGTVRMATAGSGLPTTAGQTMTQLPGLPTATATINGFFFADLSPTVAGVDTLYLCDETAGQIQKWTLAAGTWTQTGSVTLATARGLTGSVSGTTVTLFATSGGAGTPIITITDASGYNAALTGTPTTIVASAGTNKAFRGIALAPVSATPAPTVVSINRANTSPTNASSAGFTVTFSQSVTGVDSTDFALVTTGVTGASVTGVSGSGTTYTVTVNTGSGSGTVGLNLVDDDSIVTGSTPLGGSGAGNGNFTGQVYTIDKTAPAVQSIVRAGAATTNAASVQYTVTFTESVSGVDSADFTVSSSGVSGASVTNVTGSAASYTVTAGTGTGDGTIRLDVLGGSATISDAVGNPLTADFTTGDVITIDKTPPTVQSIVRVNASPTALANADYTVTFSESVVNVDTADFAVTATGVTGASVTNVAGSGATRTVTVSTGTGSSGTVRLDVIASPAINDLAGNAETTGFTTGQVYTIDRNAPSVSSVTRVTASPANAASVSFTVTFSSDVTGVDSTDFQLTTTGVTTASVTTVTPVSASVYTVAVNSGSGDGTIRLDVLNNGSIQSPAAVPLTGTTFTTGEVYTIDKTAPAVQSIARADADPTKAATVHFTVTFTESVTGVSSSTFALAATGVTGASITNVTGSGTTYTVTAGTGSGDGTLGLNAAADAAVHDTAGNAFTTPFTGAVYTVDKTAPSVLSINRADADPTNASSVHYTVTFSEAVTGVDSAGFAISASGPAGTSITGVTGSGTTYTVTVNTGSGDGTLHLDLADNDTILDTATNPLGGTGAGNGNFTGQTYTVDKNAPAVVSINRAGGATTAAASVSWTVTFSESVTGVDTSDFALAASGVTGTSITGVTGSGTTYTVSANSGSGSGTLGLNLSDDDSIVETNGFGTALGGPGAGNGNFTGQLFTLDHTAPTVLSINRASTNPTSAPTVQFTVTFSESVTGAGTADFVTAVSSVSGAAVTTVTGSGTTYTVTISTGTGSGTVGLNLADDDSIIDAAGNPLGGTGAGNGNFTGQIYTVNRAPATHLVLSQIYGGGGNSGAFYKNDFIEIFNPTGATADLTGWSVQYTSAAGTSWQVTPIAGTIAPGHYYLVQEAAGANGAAASLPAPDATGTINMSGTAGKVALVNQSSALTGSCPTGITVIDFIGFGTTATCFEGATTANLSNTTSASRIDNGCTDTDHNNTDFTLGAAAPRNSASPAWSCGNLVGNGTATPSTVAATAMTLLTVSVTPGQSPASTGITAVADLTPIGGSATQTLFDNGTNGDTTPGDNIFSFNTIVGAGTSSGSKTLNVTLADAQARNGAASIVLTVLGATNPSGSGTATPASVAPSQSSLLTVTVTPGQNPTSSSITVSADLTSIGGSASQTLFDDGTNGDPTPGDGTFSFNATVSGGASLGAKSLPVTIHDVQGRTGIASISLNVQSASAPPAPLNLVATGGNAQVSLTWTVSAGATGYNVYRSTTSGFYTTALASNVPTNSYNDTAVVNGTRYYYVVKATNGTESGPSNEATALPAAPQPAAGAKIYFIDIGQGASTLIVGPTGKSLLVDGGPTGQGTAKVVPLLATLGINTIDYTVLTHYHIDHDDGLTEVINAGKVAGTSYDNGDTAALQPPNAGSTKTAYTNYINALAAHSGTITRVRPEDVGGTLAGTVIDLGGGMRATIMAQGGHLLSGGQITIGNSDLNTESVSVFVEYNNFDFLVSGDLTGGGSTDTAKTPDVETYVAQMTGDIDVVEFDHHGSTTANNRRFLKILKAEVGEAEVGFTNTFGHPNRETFNKYLNIPDTAGTTYTGTGLPNAGSGPVGYQTDASPTSDDRCTRQGYSGASTSTAGNGTLLLKTDGTTAFTMESFDDAGARIPAVAHVYGLDATGAGVTTNFPPTVQPSISPVVPLSTETVTVSAAVFDREDPISSVTLNYAINGVAQAPATMTPAGGGIYTTTIAPQSDGTRVDYTVTAVAGGQPTSYSTGYFAGTTPISTLRAMDSLGSPLYWDYAARVQGVVTSGTGNFATGTNDDYLQDATGAINIWRTIQPSVPAVQLTTEGSIYSVAGLIGESAGRLRLEVTPPFVSATTPYQITFISNSSVPAPLAKTIAQINANPESLEAQLIIINGCHVTSGTIPGSPAALDGFLTISDGTGSFQLKVDHNTNVPGMTTPPGTFSVTGILQQDDFLRPFDSNYDIAPRSQADLGGSGPSVPGLISVAAARIDVDGSGNTPGDYVPDLLNQNVHIQGVVTSINFRSSNGSGIEYYIQDPTAGVDVFSTATTRTFNIGDNIDVVGTVKQFNGLTEIDPGATTSNLTVLAPGTLPAVTTQLVTLSQMGDNGVGEPLEGSLIRINNVTLSAPPATWAGNTNYTVTDASGTGTIRISPSANLVGQAPPAGTFSIIGVVGQFDAAAPFDSGYQISPRATTDILPAVPATASISATAGTPQSATVGTAFATQMQATVRDAGNSPISGTGVTFTAPSSGASGTFSNSTTTASVITDVNGVATSPVFTANAAAGSYSVTANSNSFTTTFSLTNLAQSATHFSVTAPANVTSGVAFNVTVTARNASNAVVTNYNGTINFSSGASGSLPADYTFVAGDNGTKTFSATLTTTGAQTITVGDGSISGSANITVAPPPATHFSVSAPANVTNGVAFNVTVTALDASNATVPSYTGTVHFTSSSAGTLPADYAFVGGDNGAHTFSVTLTTNGAQSISAGDGSISGSANTTVAPPPATHFSVSAPANVTSGVAFNVTVTALDASNATVPSYTGTVHFTSSSAGTLPADYTFVGGDNGAHTFSVTLTTNGAQSISAGDGSISGSANTTVAPPPATHFSVSAPANVTNGVAFNVTVTALDASNATVPSYAGTVHFTSSSAGTLPADYTFVGGDNGAHTFSVTLTTNGAQSISAGDGSITGSANTTVAPPPATHFSVSAPANVTSGVAFNVTVTALDASNATVPSYTGTVHFTSSSAGTLPADYAFVGGDNGAHTFSVTLTTNGAQSISAGDGSISGSANTTVAPPPATHFSVSAPANVTSGVAFNVTVTALDASNATVPSYAGTVHFTSSSAGTLPADYTFVGGDNGAHTFSVTLTTNGAQSITASDGSITGSANTTVAPPPATHFSVSVPANVTSGVAFNITVTALDVSNATVPTYAGTVHFTSSSAGTLPADYTFAGGDSGAHTFSVTLTSTGPQTISAGDGSITGIGNTTVAPPPATHFSVSAPANVTNGVAFNVTVTALDASNATVPSYAGTVHFTSSSAGTLPADYTFVAGDNGAHIFSVTLTTNGAQSIAAGDGSITGSANTTVAPPPATHFNVSAPANVTGGFAFNITVTALDASNATVPTYAGTVHFTSSSAGTLPADYTFAGGDNGVHTFSVTLTSTGPQTISAGDGSISGTGNTTVVAAPATHYSVSAPVSVTVGAPFNITVTALDASNGTVTGYTGTAHFTSSSTGTLPAGYTFVAGDHGTQTFSVTLTSPGSQTITAADTVTASINGSASTTNVCPPGPAPSANATNSGPACVGTTVNLFGTGNGSVFSWTGPGGFNSTQQNPAGITVAGTYTVVVSTPGPCGGSAQASTTVVINPIPIATITTGGTACALSPGNSASVPDAGLGATYVWSITNGTITAGAGTRTITYTAGAAGNVQLAVTVSASSCNANGTADAAITSGPAITLPASLTACGPSTVTVPFTLTGNAPWTVHWSDGSTQSGIVSSPSSRTVSASASMLLSVVSVTDASCTSSGNGAAVFITIATAPAITTQPVGQIVSPGERATFTVVASGQNLHYQWFVKHANGATLPAGTDAPSYTTVAEGNAVWFVRVTNTCGSVDSNRVDAQVVTPRHRPSH